MKKILLGLVGLIILVVVAFAVAAFVAPTSFAVEREIVIERSRADVFNYLKLIKNQNEWGPWLKKDPNTKVEYEGEDGTVGFVSKWESDHPEVGAGEQKITKIIENERIDVELNFKEPFESTSQGHTILEPAGEGKTKVRWGFKGEMPRPMNLMLVFTDLDAEAGKEFESGLKTLKEELEQSE